MPNDMRDRLIELLTDNLPHCDNPLQDTYDEIVERLANHLIKNGVILTEKRYKCPKCGRILTPRADNKYYFCFNCMNEFTREDAEKALMERERE